MEILVKTSSLVASIYWASTSGVDAERLRGSNWRLAFIAEAIPFPIISALFPANVV